MFNWLGGGKPDHPMADIKEARKLLAELPAGDAFKALEEAAYWLESLNHAGDFRPELRYGVVDLIDQAARQHQRKLSQEYLLAPRMQKFQENRLWTVIHEFWRHLGAAYLLCIEQYQAGAAGAGAIKQALPAVAGRALKAHAMQLKWSLLRYGPIEERIWRDLGSIYAFAETKGFADRSVTLYPGAESESSVQRELLKALMLGISSADSLLPVKIEITERIIAHFSPAFAFGQTRDETCPHFFDLSAGQAPGRLAQEPGPQPPLRFFGAGDALPGLEKLTQLAVKNMLPAELNLGASYKSGVVLEVLRHLARYWAVQPPPRGHQRHKAKVMLIVMHGFTDISSGIAGGSGGPFAESEIESWIADNVSDGGYGAVIPQISGDWLKITGLLGIKAEGAPHWGIGIIRRLSRDHQMQYRVGVQSLSKTALPVTMIPAQGADDHAAGSVVQALLLSTSPDSAGEITVVLPIGNFSSKQNFEMRVKEKGYLLLPAKLIEGGEDYDLAKFRVMQRIAS